MKKILNATIKQNLHNPKAHAPAVYIPSWLIQIPNAKLSLGAKIVYGRLAQWANDKGTVHRSTKQLCNELGMTISPVERYLKELRKVGLIGTFQIEKGGVNHFEFYDHEWMHDPINSDLCYPPSISSKPTVHIDGIPTSKQTVPPPLNRRYPPSKQTELKYKEIKVNKRNNIASEKESSLNPPDVGFSTIFSSTKKDANKPKTQNQIDIMLSNNPYNLQKQALEDFLTIRRTKRSPITRTCWEGLLNELGKCERNGLKAVDCFTTMIMSGWQSLKAEWFQEKTKTGKGLHSSNEFKDLVL